LRRFEDIVTLLYRIPSSLNDILNEKFLDELIKAVKELEPGFPQIKLLSMIQKRADFKRKLEIRRLLLQKIMYLSHKIAQGASGITKTVVTEYRPGMDEIDVGRTVEEQLGRPTLNYENIYCSERRKQKASYVLMLDVSNSMHLEKIAIATIATGVFASKLRNDFHAVLTFSREANIIKHIYEPNNLKHLLNKMLYIESGGATNIRETLLEGLELLNESKTHFKTGIIVTDGWATVGGDPVEIASKYDKLHVLGISFGLGGYDPATNSLMAQRGRGRYVYIKKFDDLPIAITKILAGK